MRCLFIVSQIINVKDPNWWQAKHIGNNDVIGLIPSLELEERRKAFVPPEADFVHSISICGTRVSAFIIYISFPLEYSIQLRSDLEAETEEAVQVEGERRLRQGGPYDLRGGHADAAVQTEDPSPDRRERRRPTHPQESSDKQRPKQVRHSYST